MSCSTALATTDWQALPANSNDADPDAALAALRAALAAQEPVIGAAVLVATAFRLRDEGGLITTLRCLTQAVRDMEAQDAEAEAMEQQATVQG
ncbi:MAG: hypothetical protein U1E17_10415 [Geminicoccaceae bacterium]